MRFLVLAFLPTTPHFQIQETAFLVQIETAFGCKLYQACGFSYLLVPGMNCTRNAQVSRYQESGFLCHGTRMRHYSTRNAVS
eukprot:3824113-Rhodomonas_salina.2